MHIFIKCLIGIDKLSIKYYYCKMCWVSCYLHNVYKSWVLSPLPEAVEGGGWRGWNHDSEQVTPASSVWSQLCTFQDMWEHCWSEPSAPLHLRLSRRMVPAPGPKKASTLAAAAGPQPSWRHTTWASGRSQASSHTVPHAAPENISTRPSH